MAVLCVLLTTSWFQTRQVRHLTELLESKIQIPVTIGKVRFVPFRDLFLSDVCVYSEQKDTILYVPEMEVSLNLLSLKKNRFSFSEARLTRPDIYFKTDSTGRMNFQFILDKLAKKDSTGNRPLDLKISRIYIEQSHFRLTGVRKKDSISGVNFSDLDLKNLKVIARNFELPEDGGVAFRLDTIQTLDKSGFNLSFLSADVLLDAHQFSFKKVKVETPASRIKAQEITLSFGRSGDLGSGRFNSLVHLNFDLQPSVIALSDLACFIPSFRAIPDTAFVSGIVQGTVSDLRGMSLDIGFGRGTRFKGDIELKGLPDIENTYIYCNAEHFETLPADVEKFPSVKSASGKLVLPIILHRLKYLRFKGNFTGFLQDFVAYGDFQTGLGDFSTDILFNPVKNASREDTASAFSYSGLLKSTDFRLGDLMDSKGMMGNISLETSVIGTISRSAIVNAEMKGTLSKLEINRYPYQNITINGTVHGKTYDGQVLVEDPHLKGNFSGKADLSGEIPAWQFSAEVRQADLFYMNIAPSDSAWFTSFGIDADFSGNRMDNLDGEIRLKNALLKKTGNTLQMNDFLLFTKQIEGENRFVLRSDVVDAEVWGQYSFATLQTSLLALLKRSLPSLVYNPEIIGDESDENNFQCEINFKNTSAISDFFLPGIYISRSSLLKGAYNSQKGLLSFSANIPFVEVKGKRLYDIKTLFSIDNDQSRFDLNLLKLNLNETTGMENLSLKASGTRDSVDYRLVWGNENKSFSGDLHGLLSLIGRPAELPVFAFQSDPAGIYLNGEPWELKPDLILVDSASLKINRFSLTNRDQSMVLSGSVSSHPEDKLQLEFNKMELSLLDMLLRSNNLQLKGLVSGSADFRRLFEKPLVDCDLSIDTLSFNGELMGNASLKANYDQNRQSVLVRFESWDKTRRSLSFNGQYDVNSGLLDFTLNLQDVGVGLAQPFVKGIFSNMKGTASGEVKLTGTVRKPVMNGNVSLENTGLTVNFLNTSYLLSGSVQVAENAFLLGSVNPITIFDSKGHTCLATGKMLHHFFKGFTFDFQLDAINFEALNIPEKEASIFYGNGYASGSVHIYGPPKNLNFDIDVKTEPNTRVFIPLSDQSEVNQVDFIDFVEKEIEKPKLETVFDDLKYDDRKESPDYVINKKGITLDIELEVVPSAEVQLIFDRRTGEVIRGSGSGKLRFSLTPNGRFNMYGSYMVEKGDYLFTLQNLFQREFEVQRGGTITWSGDPVNAIINMTGIYRTRTSLDGLLSMNNAVSPSKRVPVECVIKLSDRLMKPTLQFDLQMPDVDQDVRELVAGLLTTEEQKSKQVISLLVLNSFYSDLGTTNIDPSSIATDMISNQIGRILDRLSDKFSIGVGYHRYNQLQTQIIELTASAALFKERMNASLTVANREVINTSNPVTFDGNIEYRLTNSGRYYLKAFNRANDLSLLEPDTYYTQGLGLVYRTDFDRFADIFIRPKRNLIQTIPMKKDTSDTPVVRQTSSGNLFSDSIR